MQTTGPPDQNDDLPIERSTGELFFDVADDLRALFNRACDEIGLTPMETTTLRHAARHRQQTAIVEELGLTPTRVSGLLGALERKGLLTRTKARGDHRQREVTLTARGRSAVATFNARMERESPLLLRLDDAQRATLRELLLILRAWTRNTSERIKTDTGSHTIIGTSIRKYRSGQNESCSAPPRHPRRWPTVG